MKTPADKPDQPTRKIRLARQNAWGIIIPRWWRNRVAIAVGVVAVASVIFALDSMHDAKDRLPESEPSDIAESEIEPAPEPQFESQPEPSVDNVSTPDEPMFPELHNGETDVTTLAYEEALPGDLIEDAPVIYPDATGPRVVVPEEFIPEPVVIREPVAIRAPEVIDDPAPGTDAAVEDAVEPESIVQRPPPLPLPSIDPALEEVLVAISTSQLDAMEESEHHIELWQENAVTFDLASAIGKPMIAIVIDDMGVDVRRSRIAAALPGPLTLSYLTYAQGLELQTMVASNNGHELMLHVPMQPESDTVDPGPEVLRTEDRAEEVLRRLRWGLSQFKGYVGINNHMGSRFTRDLDGMRVVLAEIKARGLLFLDSRTSGQSVATAAAHEFDVPFATRNVFLDHVDDEIEIYERLIETERLARKNGSAIAIGHPRDATLKIITEWLPTLESKGIVLAPISALVHHNWKPEPLSIASTPDQQ